MSDKPVTMMLGITVISGVFGLCVMGFFLLYGMVTTNRAEAAQALTKAIENRNLQINRMADLFEAYRLSNDRDHKEIMMMLGKLIQKP